MAPLSASPHSLTDSWARVGPGICIFIGRDAASDVCGVGDRVCGGLLEPRQERGGWWQSRGTAGGQQKAISQDSIDFQAAGASCRLDSTQVLMGTSPGQSRTEAEKECGDRQTGGVG